jgi:hypothetical protein
MCSYNGLKKVTDSMKILCKLSVLVAFFCCAVLAQDVSVSGLTLRIERISASGVVTVSMTNSSKKPIRVWQETNSWGVAHWRVLIIRNGQLYTFFQNPHRGFTINAPRFTEIAPGKYIQHDLDVNGGNWCDSDQCAQFDERGVGGKEISFKTGDTAIVLYDVPPAYDPGIRRLGVWYGVASVLTTIE